MTSRGLAETYRRFIVMVRRCAFKIVLDPVVAEDVAQEVFVKYLEFRDRHTEERDTAAFLYRMTTNMAITKIRKAQRRSKLLAKQGPPNRAALGQAEDRLLLQEILLQVTEQEAQIAVYYYVAGMEQEEIGELLSLPRRTVGRRLERFRQKARTLLEQKSP